MSEKVNCPFCGSIIESDAIRCPSCSSLFKEPELPGVRCQNFAIFTALYFVLRGWFGVLWFLFNTRAINSLATNKKDKLKFNWLIILLISIAGVYSYYFAGKIPLSVANISSLVFLYIIYAGLTYRILRIIQKYSEKTYGITPDINPNYVVFFTVFYLVHFIDTYANRIWEIHEHFNMKLPHWIMLIIIFSIAPMAIFVSTPQFSVVWNSLKHLLNF